MEANAYERRAGRRHKYVWLKVLAASAVLLIVSPALRGQSRDAEGADLFRTYCAPCHGVDAVGNGPMARALRHAPADLTLLSKRNGGMFPATRVRRIIEGRDVESHGDRDMPVWGDAFAPNRDGRSSAAAAARLSAIVRYLESIQRHDAQ